MNRILNIVLIIIIAASLVAIGIAFLQKPTEEVDSGVKVVEAPEQSKAQRPPCFPDPEANYIPMPETTNLAQGKPDGEYFYDIKQPAGTIKRFGITSWRPAGPLPASTTAWSGPMQRQQTSLQKIRSETWAAIGSLRAKSWMVWQRRTKDTANLPSWRTSMDWRSATTRRQKMWRSLLLYLWKTAFLR